MACPAGETVEVSPMAEPRDTVPARRTARDCAVAGGSAAARPAARSGLTPSACAIEQASAASPPSRSGRSARRRRSTPPRWTGSPSAPPTPSARARAPRCCWPPEAFVGVDTGDPLPDGFDAVVMREHVHYVDGRAELRAGGRALPARALDRRGHQRHRTAATRGASAAPGRRRGRRGRGRHRGPRPPPAGRGDPADRRRDATDRLGARARRAARDTTH